VLVSQDSRLIKILQVGFRARCKYCSAVMAQNITRQRDHLASCKLAFEASTTRKPKRQKTLDFSAMSKSALDSKLATWIFVSARPFSSSEEFALQDLLSGMSRGYTMPSRSTISRSLLPRCYEKMKSTVVGELQKIQHLNLAVDETTTIRGQRILNLSISTVDKSYYFMTEDMGDKPLDAQNIAEWTLKAAEELLRLLGPTVDWGRTNSLASDTRNTMKASDILRANSRTRNTFFIPCDSHSLQLVIKDILGLPK
jgi:Protein of unknown function (DUF 659)